MDQLTYKDIVAPKPEPIITLDSFVCVGDAVSDGEKSFKVKENGGIKTQEFKTNSDSVSVAIDCRSEKPLTIRIGIINSKGESRVDLLRVFTVQPGDDGIVRLRKWYDASGLLVYCDAQSFFVQVDCAEENSFSVVGGSIRNCSDMERLSVYAGNLEDVFKRIEKRFGEIEYSAHSYSENVAVSPNGSRFIINVDNDGKLYTTPIVPSKVLVVGNSLLLGMCNSYGMCATSPRSDFYYQVCEGIKKKNPDAEFSRAHGARFEQLDTPEEFDEYWSSEENVFTKKPICESFTEDLDLIIIQLGTNVNTKQRADAFRQNIDKWISLIKQKSPRARILWVHGWGNAHLSGKTIIDACRRWGIGQISIKDLSNKENYAHYGQEYELPNGNKAIASDYWLTHPGDDGMKRIAERILNFLNI